MPSARAALHLVDVADGVESPGVLGLERDWLAARCARRPRDRRSPRAPANDSQEGSRSPAHRPAIASAPACSPRASPGASPSMKRSACAILAGRNAPGFRSRISSRTTAARAKWPSTASPSARTSVRSSTVPPPALRRPARASVRAWRADRSSSSRARIRLAKPFRACAATRSGSHESARARSAPVEALWAARPCTAASKAETAPACALEWRSPNRSVVPDRPSARLPRAAVDRARSGIDVRRDVSAAVKDILSLRDVRLNVMQASANGGPAGNIGSL